MPIKSNIFSAEIITLTNRVNDINLNFIYILKLLKMTDLVMGLSNLPIDIYRLLSALIGVDSFLNLMIVNNNNMSLCKPIYNLLSKKHFITSNFCPTIIDLFKDVNYLTTCPILKYHGSYGGQSGYIDNIPVDDISHPIMIGIDNANRPFVTIRTQINIGSNVYTAAEVLFQRYSNDTNTWTKAGVYGAPPGWLPEAGIIIRGGIQNDLLKENINNLINEAGHILYYDYASSLYHPVIVKRAARLV